MRRRLLPLLLLFSDPRARFGDDAALFQRYPRPAWLPIIQGNVHWLSRSRWAGPVQPALFMPLARQPRFRKANFRLVRSYIEGNIKTGSQYTFLNKGQGQQGHGGRDQLPRAEVMSKRSPLLSTPLRCR